MSKNAWASVAAIVIALAGLFVFWMTRVPQPPDCSFSGWKRSVGVELETQVKDLDALKGKLGISDSQVRDYDDLMRDYALKYDAACQDVRAKRMTDGQYTCLRNNMDRVLDDIREFVRTIQAANTLSDPVLQKEAVNKGLAGLAGARGRYMSGCTSAMDVNPRELRFRGMMPERSIQLTNRGNNDVTFSIDGLPEAFDPKPISGTLTRGTTASVAILRTLLPVPPTQPITFHVRTNLQDDELVQISVDAQNATLWKNLGGQFKPHDTVEGSLDEAVQMVSDTLGKATDVPLAHKYLFAAQLLTQVREASSANLAVERAIDRDPTLGKQSTTLLLSGLIANQKAEKEKAAELFAKAADSAPKSDATAKAVAGLFAGSLKVTNGEQPVEFKNPTVKSLVLSNPAIAAYTQGLFCPPTRCGPEQRMLLAPQAIQAFGVAGTQH